MVDEEVPVYMGFYGAKFNYMELQIKTESEHQKTKDYIRDQLVQLSKDQLIENFIKFLVDSRDV